ncbi:unnamed protein product [Larinioides sclopetarius]|uniref:Uncharacterized protein n=1 Tax=Larinioides sclopetarius TaxID=280406 RepID=A0AAV2BVQ2_9ARAC
MKELEVSDDPTCFEKWAILLSISHCLGEHTLFYPAPIIHHYYGCLSLMCVYFSPNIFT